MSLSGQQATLLFVRIWHSGRLDTVLPELMCVQPGNSRELEGLSHRLGIAVELGTDMPASRYPNVTVVPAAGLRNTEVVTVTASGLRRNEALQVVQCGDKCAKTGPADCSLVAMLSVTSDESGTLTARPEVVRGPFGGNQVTCGKLQPCLVSVTRYRCPRPRKLMRPSSSRRAEGGRNGSF